MIKMREACPECERGCLEEVLTFTRDEAEEPILVLSCEERGYERFLRRPIEEEVEQIFRGELSITVMIESAISTKPVTSP